MEQLSSQAQKNVTLLKRPDYSAPNGETNLINGTVVFRIEEKHAEGKIGVRWLMVYSELATTPVFAIENVQRVTGNVKTYRSRGRIAVDGRNKISWRCSTIASEQDCLPI